MKSLGRCELFTADNDNVLLYLEMIFHTASTASSRPRVYKGVRFPQLADSIFFLKIPTSYSLTYHNYSIRYQQIHQDTKRTQTSDQNRFIKKKKATDSTRKKQADSSRYQQIHQETRKTRKTQNGKNESQGKRKKEGRKTKNIPAMCQLVREVCECGRFFAETATGCEMAHQAGVLCKIMRDVRKVWPCNHHHRHHHQGG